MPDMTAVWPTDQSPGNVSSEARWRKMARLWAASGVDVSPLAIAGGLAPTLAAGPIINVAAGAAWVDGHYAELTPGTAIPATANGVLVARFTPADGRCQLVYVDAGVLPPTRTAATWELAIASMAAGALTDRRMFLQPGSPPVFPNFATLKALYPGGAGVPDGSQATTNDDGRTWTFRAASFTPNAIVGALPANRWETRVQMMNPGAATDSGGIGTIPASAFGLDGLIAINGAGGWAASAFPQLSLHSMRWSSQSAGQIRLYTISGSPSGTVAFYASQSNITLLLDAYGYRLG